MSSRFAPMAILALACVCASCAKKMLPPSPDRFAPHLIGVESRTRGLVELQFDEEVDARRVMPDSVLIRDAKGGLVVPKRVATSRSRDRLTIWAPLVPGSLYALSLAVPDRFGNWARVKTRFVAATRSDSVAPRVVRVTPSPGTGGFRFGAQIRVSFSEAIDTTGTRTRLLVMPKERESLFDLSWEADWQTLRISNQDSLVGRSPIYVLLLPGLADLAGNRTRSAAFTYLSPDSVFTGPIVKGRAVWRSAGLGTGVVLFEHDSSPGLTPILADGSFRTQLLPGWYDAVAVVDTNLDGLADLSGASDRFSTDQESLSIALESVPSPKPLGSYRR